MRDRDRQRRYWTVSVAGPISKPGVGCVRYVTTMRDSLLRAGWRSCVLAMIFVAGMLCLSLSYRAAFDLISGAWPSSATLAAVSLVAGLGVKWLCENRNDLVEA